VRIAVYYDLAEGGAAFALRRFVEHLRRGHEVDVFAPAGAWPVVGDVRLAGPRPRSGRAPGALYYLNRFTLPIANRRLVRIEAGLAETLLGYDRRLVHSCRNRGAPALLEFLNGDAHLYVTEPLRLYREPRPPDGAPPAAWIAGRAITLPIWRGLNAADRRHAREAGRVLANSRYTASRCEAVYGRRAEVVVPPVDPHYLEEPPGEGEGDYVLSPGAFLPQKGHGRVVRALATLPRRPALLVAGFRGQESYRRRLEALAERLAVPMKTISDPTRPVLRSLVRRARVVAVGAVREPFGLVAVEAQAAGRPVVVVDEGGLPETVAAGESGLTTPAGARAFGEAIARIWEDRGLERRMGAAGRERARVCFAPEACGARLETALEAPSGGGAP
jgi:glycosyltransferase involved in cell wall biosynthesis